MIEWYESFLGDVKDFTRYLKDNTEEMDEIKIREMNTPYNMEGTILYLL